ncbi:MAG: hypothetical protein AAGM38_07970 [Pseudomonadota bacterium]
MSEMERKTVLAVASGGGHWQQLMLVAQAFDGFDVRYATTMEGLTAAEPDGSPAEVTLIRDFNRSNPLVMLKAARQLMALCRRVRPSVVVSTGAAPGLLALAVGKLYGARTIWIDSVANSEKLSMSGKTAGWICDLWVTQWPHLEKSPKLRYFGRLL